MTEPPRSNSSRELLQRIGLELDAPADLGLETESPESSDRDLALALRTRVDSLQRRHDFKPGASARGHGARDSLCYPVGQLASRAEPALADLVSWKPGLCNRRMPRYGRPAVVVEVLPDPVLDNAKDSGDAYFREPLDIVLGVFLEQGRHRGDFIAWHYDSRRFQLWTPAE